MPAVSPGRSSDSLNPSLPAADGSSLSTTSDSPGELLLPKLENKRVSTCSFHLNSTSYDVKSGN